MSKNMYFSKDHEWITVDGDNMTLGISNFAANELGDVVFVELPEVGLSVKAGEKLAVVESVKAVSDILAPVDMEVVEVNTELESSPEMLGTEAESAGWILKATISDISQVDGLMDKESYDAFIKDGGR